MNYLDWEKSISFALQGMQRYERERLRTKRARIFFEGGEFSFPFGSFPEVDLADNRPCDIWRLDELIVYSAKLLVTYY